MTSCLLFFLHKSGNHDGLTSPLQSGKHDLAAIAALFNKTLLSTGCRSGLENALNALNLNPDSKLAASSL